MLEAVVRGKRQVGVTGKRPAVFTSMRTAVVIEDGGCYRQED